MVVDDMREGCMVWDVAEKHFSKEVVLDAKNFGQVTFYRLKGQVLLGLALFLLSIFTKIIQINITQSVEYLESVWQEVIINTAFKLVKIMVLHIKALDMNLRIYELLHSLDEITASDVVEEVKHDEWYAKLEMYIFNKLINREEGLALLGVHDFILLVDKVAQEWFSFMLGNKARGASSTHFFHKHFSNWWLLFYKSFIVFLLDLFVGLTYLSIDLFNLMFVRFAISIIPVGVWVDLTLFLLICEHGRRQECLCIDFLFMNVN